MERRNHIYAAIDLKSYYASVECVWRGLDPLETNLVVADKSRTDKTICLAVSPPMKALGIPARPRLFEVIQRVREINADRRRRAPERKFKGSSCNYNELMEHPELEMDYIVATPRMGRYMEQSADIYEIYMRYAAPEDIHVYSIDEVFMDITGYLRPSGCSAREYTRRMISDVFGETGITATAGIGTNLYLAKVAMDIVAKHSPPDENGVRIAELDETEYRKKLWDHQPITDFWRVGRGYARKLAEHGMFTMGDVARCSIGGDGDIQNEELLYKLFGVNAELLIDHAWGWESCTIKDIKAYRPENKSIGSGQVLQSPYTTDRAKIVVLEMADQLALDLMSRGLVTDRIVLTVGYDRENLNDPKKINEYEGTVKIDHYGRLVPKHGHGTEPLGEYTSSGRIITNAAGRLFDKTAENGLLIRRINLTAENVVPEGHKPKPAAEQIDLFTDYSEREKAESEKDYEREKEKKLQKAILDIKDKYGKNSILKGISLEDGATARDRNSQIGGHRA